MRLLILLLVTLQSTLAVSQHRLDPAIEYAVPIIAKAIHPSSSVEDSGWQWSDDGRTLRIGVIASEFLSGDIHQTVLSLDFSGGYLSNITVRGCTDKGVFKCFDAVTAIKNLVVEYYFDQYQGSDSTLEQMSLALFETSLNALSGKQLIIAVTDAIIYEAGLWPGAK